MASIILVAVGVPTAHGAEARSVTAEGRRGRGHVHRAGSIGDRPGHSAKRRQRRRCGRGDGVRPGRHLPGGRQHRRRRLHGRPPAGGKAEPVVIDYRETAPAAATQDHVRQGRQPATAYMLVGVPGTVRGLALAHKRFGKLPWKDVVLPAVKLAEDGFVIDAAAGRLAQPRRRRVAGLPRAAPRLRQGRRQGDWKAGDRLVQPDLAEDAALHRRARAPTPSTRDRSPT